MAKSPQHTYDSVCVALENIRNQGLDTLSGIPNIGNNIHNIHTIFNNYSFLPASFLIPALAEMVQLPDTESSLLRFGRFCEALSSVEISGLPEEHSRGVGRVFASSNALSNRLIAFPDLLALYNTKPNPLLPEPDIGYYRARYKSELESLVIVSEKVTAVHRIHSVELVRICARNADPSSSLPEINHELSLLAEATIGVCLDLAHAMFHEHHESTGNSHNLVVLGLGKLGGAELNVSSDIDLIYLCGDQSQSWGRYDNVGYHVLLAERMTRLLTDPTVLGFLYRVDTRLRADGSSGPLVRTGDDYFRYLELRGEVWERQMLLKARPVAGDFSLGESFLSTLERFIYPSSISRSPNREIVEIKNRIENRIVVEGSKKTHLKLVPGGVRDIEFIVQALQLLMGGAHREVRTKNTLESIERLFASGALKEDERDILRPAYVLYRRIENALQWAELLPAFTIPDTPEDTEKLALYLGYGSSGAGGEALLVYIDRSLSAVRAVYNNVFSLEQEESFENRALMALRHNEKDERVRRFLESIGFTNPVESARALKRIASGGDDAPSPDSGLNPAIERFIPAFLKRVSALPDPGGAVERFARIVAAYGSHIMLFDVLNENPTFADLIVTLAHGSVFMTDILTADPSLLDWLVEVGELLKPADTRTMMTELSRLNSLHAGPEAFTQACLAFKNREKLRIGARDISGLTDTLSTFRDLSAVAECICRTVTERSIMEIAVLPSANKEFAFTVIACGRLGAGMMDFGSDLDLIYVYRATDDFDDALYQETAIRIAQRIQSYLAGGGVFRIFDVDARLRPEGGNAPLAVSLEEYDRYLTARADVWERLALVRARHVAGNAPLAKDMTEILERFVYGKPFSASDIDRILSIRARMIDQSRERHPGLVNVKSGKGGMTDIDFIAQSYACHYGEQYPKLRNHETGTILKILSTHDLIERHDATSLLDRYEFLCVVEKSLRIGSGRSINTVPASEHECARIAAILGIKNVRRFRKLLDETIEVTASLYESLMGELRARAKDGRKS